MQGDVSGTRATEDYYGSSDPGLAGMIEEKQPLDYLFDTYDVTASGVSRIVTFLADRPVVAGSIVIGIVGAVLGTRLAEYQARRQRQSFYRKAAGSLGSSSAVVSDWFSRKPMATADAIRQRGLGLVASHNGNGISQRIPVIGKGQKKDEGIGKQIGYMIGLIPPILALVRNPLVRNMGLRMLTRKIPARGGR
jgi:hypothetical protein